MPLPGKNYREGENYREAPSCYPRSRNLSFGILEIAFTVLYTKVNSFLKIQQGEEIWWWFIHCLAVVFSEFSFILNLDFIVKKTDVAWFSFLCSDLPGGYKLGVGRRAVGSYSQVAFFKSNMFQDSISQDTILEATGIF